MFKGVLSSLLMVLFIQGAAYSEYLVDVPNTRPDGDSFYVADNIRLYGIDCPEKDQPFGPEARNFTQRLLDGENFDTQCSNSGAYGRSVCRVVIRGKGDLGILLVKNGLAWVTDKYIKYDVWYYHALKVQEDYARRYNKGIWSLPENERVAPWVHRKQ